MVQKTPHISHLTAKQAQVHQHPGRGVRNAAYNHFRVECVAMDALARFGVDLTHERVGRFKVERLGKLVHHLRKVLLNRRFSVQFSAVDPFRRGPSQGIARDYSTSAGHVLRYSSAPCGHFDGQGEERLLPDTAVVHFNHLCASDFASGWRKFADDQREFERRETGGRGEGYAARLATLYQREFERRAQFILATLKDVHRTFGAPLGESVLNQLLDVAARTLSDQLQAIEGAYMRHVQPFGLLGVASGLSDRAPLQQAAIANALRQHFWTLEHVPVKKDASPQATMTFNGPVGAVQTGSHAVANVSQQWNADTVTAAIDQLNRFRELLEREADIEPSLRPELVRDIDNAKAELALEKPSAGRVSRWLGGVGAAIQTVGALQPAWEMVRSAIRALGVGI